MSKSKQIVQKDVNLLISMKKIIHSYFEGSFAIIDLINDLESMLNQLTSVSSAWKKKFRLNWLDIEIAYSLALDQGLDQFNPKEEEIVFNSLQILREMITEKLKSIDNDSVDHF